MTKHTKSLIFFLTSLTVMGCFQANIKQTIEWINLANVPNGLKILLEYSNNNEKTVKRKLYVKQTSSFSIPEEYKLCSKSHSADFILKLYPNQKNNWGERLEIYLFPTRDIVETENSYIVKEQELICAYFIEGYNEDFKRGYYIFSKNNQIMKPKEICEGPLDLKKIIEELDSDYAIFNKEEQKLAQPYNGYVVKSKIDDSYLMLSTLWDKSTF